MEYVIAAYAVAIGSVGLYLWHLVRERKRLLAASQDASR
ncbi:MAG: heme exporter protein CcmD [Myxococcota bacterium]|nr:heme exporter protein CcmD [Myxococcota bacterium]